MIREVKILEVDVSKFDVGDLLVVEKCEECDGEGVVENAWFEACRNDDTLDGECSRCEISDWCDEGEYIGCHVCNGTGKVIVKKEG